MEFTREDILKVAEIAHLSLGEDEVEMFTKDLEQMVDFAKALDEIDMSDSDEEVEEPAIYNIFRKDEIQPSMAKEDLLANAPQEKNGCFFVPQIVE